MYMMIYVQNSSQRVCRENDIAFIHDADNDVKKKELFAKVRKGDVAYFTRFHTKNGSRDHVQTRLYASHDLDCPWRPSDLEQRAGRIIRQGNTNDTRTYLQVCYKRHL